MTRSLKAFSLSKHRYQTNMSTVIAYPCSFEIKTNIHNSNLLLLQTPYTSCSISHLSITLLHGRKVMFIFNKSRCLTISEKQNVIEVIVKDQWKVDVANVFNIPLTSFSIILKNKEKCKNRSRGGWLFIEEKG